MSLWKKCSASIERCAGDGDSLWDVDRVPDVNSTPPDGTVFVLPYQVVLGLQELVGIDRCGLLTTFLLHTGVFSMCFPPIIQPWPDPLGLHMFDSLEIKLRDQRFTSDSTVKSEAEDWLGNGTYTCTSRARKFSPNAVTVKRISFVTKRNRKAVVTQHNPVLYSSLLTCVFLKVG
jgi:hypothetical protein